ncbi:MAG: transcription termination factor NusA [Sphingomonadaceae bacterium]
MKSDFVTAISQLCSEKGVTREAVMHAIEVALVSAYKKNFAPTGQNVTAQIDPATGAVRIFAEKQVVEQNGEAGPDKIPLDVARKIRPDIQVGETLAVETTPPNFGRIAAQTAKQVILQRLRDEERRMIYDEYHEREGELLHGVVQRIENRTVYIDLGKAEGVMAPSDQVPTERYHPGQRLRVYLVEVHDTHKGPQIIVSRNHKAMLRRLFEQEVPEIFNGTVELKAIAREAGARSKVAVAARQEGIDPVGSCVGMRGVRIQNIVNELGGEKIDVVQWSPDAATFVANALSPAQVISVDINEEEKTATVIVPERQLSLAIGKEGQNARLAAKLTGWRIDIKAAGAEPVGPEVGETATESVQ